MMKKWLLIILFGILIVGSSASSYYFYNKYQIASGKTTDREIKVLVGKVKKIMLLHDEMPTLATVTDKSKLGEQKFFRNSENNDKVLIYAQAAKAILYRPSENKIIEVASVNMNDQSQLTVATPTVVVEKQTEKVGVVLYNGTATIGLTTKYEKILSEKFTGVVILGKETANNTNYLQTVVIDITGRSTQLAKDVADSLGGKIGVMPSGENPPVADILVILGKNSK